MPIDYTAAKSLLDNQFRDIENELLAGHAPEAPNAFEESFGDIFASTTQAYREALLGCCIARIQDKTLNIRRPYINLGEHAFNGRTLDEKVVNPFLQENRIPASRGYFGLSVRGSSLPLRGRRIFPGPNFDRSRQQRGKYSPGRIRSSFVFCRHVSSGYRNLVQDIVNRPARAPSRFP